MSAASRRLMRLRCYQLEDASRALDQSIAYKGPDHPRTRAARGRLWVYLGRVPQPGQESPEAIAWERESGRAPGYQNRAYRKHRGEPAADAARTSKATQGGPSCPTSHPSPS